MKITKNGQEIRCVDDWLRLAPPKQGERHWVEGQSAKELAKAWFPGRYHEPQAPHIPDELQSLLNSATQKAATTLLEGEAECEIRFDEFAGPRNADLQIKGSADGKAVSISVEAKADEYFGERYLAETSFAQVWRTGTDSVPTALRRLCCDGAGAKRGCDYCCFRGA